MRYILILILSCSPIMAGDHFLGTQVPTASGLAHSATVDAVQRFTIDTIDGGPDSAKVFSICGVFSKSSSSTHSNSMAIYRADDSSIVCSTKIQNSNVLDTLMRNVYLVAADTPVYLYADTGYFIAAWASDAAGNEYVQQSTLSGKEAKWDALAWADWPATIDIDDSTANTQYTICANLIGYHSSGDTATALEIHPIFGDMSTEWEGLTSNNLYLKPDETDSAWIYVAGWGYDIPSDATVDSIAVTVEGKSSPAKSNQAKVGLTKDAFNSAGDEVNADIGDFGDATVTVTGSTNKLWGTTWTPAQINSNNFMVLIKRNVTDNLEIDQVSLQVFWTEIAVSTSNAQII